MDAPLTALERIAGAARIVPDRACVILGDDALTYRQVDERASAIARALAADGLGHGRRVAVLGPNHVLTLVATLGILRSGATWIPLNPRDSAESLADLCRRFRTDAVIYHGELTAAMAEIRAHAPTVAATIPLAAGHGPGAGLLEWATRFRDAPPPDPPPLDALAAVFATGGTTGVPKGVCYSHRTLAAIVGNVVALLDHADPVFLAAGPLTHVSGRIGLGIMAAGGTTVVLRAFDARAALDAIERHRVTTMMLPTTLLMRLVAEPSLAMADVSSVRRIAVGASPVPVDLIKRAISRFGPVVAQNYGQTEAPMFITSMHPDEYLVAGRFAPDARLASCGRPTPFSEVRVVTDDGRDAGVGEVGEIVVRGNFVMDGYLDDEASTVATRLGPFHRTGDLGTLDEDGYLTIVGRRRDMIITGGFNVYPAEIECVLTDRAEVHEAAVIGLPDAEWGERVVAVVEPAAGAVCQPDELRRYVRERLGAVKTPKQVVLVDALPRNANGKILKRTLVEQLGGRGGPQTGLTGRGR